MAQPAKDKQHLSNHDPSAHERTSSTKSRLHLVEEPRPQRDCHAETPLQYGMDFTALREMMSYGC